MDKPINNTRAIRYLAYGSNLHPARLQARISSAVFDSTVKLCGWSLNFSKIGRDGSGKCNIIRNDSDTIHGAIYKISIQDLKTLDVIEGANKGYHSTTILIPRVGVCNVYLAHEPFIDHHENPYHWYKELVLAGARYHLFPSGYIKSIEMTPSKVDLDTKRAKDNLSVLMQSS